MAELETKMPSSVTDHLEDEPASGSGVSVSEVNKTSCEDDVKINMSSSDTSNESKPVDVFPLLNVSEFTNQPTNLIPEENNSTFTEIEVQENKKNEQLSQQSVPTSTVLPSSSAVVDENISKDALDSCKDEINGTTKTGKKKRRIRFSDESCPVSGCLEPPDPWKNQPLWTTDELISAYKKSCEVNGCKPIVKILQQLHGISSPGKRRESFVLKGEKLDSKQIECIEEVFRRVQFYLLDFEASHLDDECAVALFEMIEHYESACQLNVSFNRNISARGWQACSRLVRRTPSLTYLDIRNCDLNERTIPLFGRALKLGCHLTVLHMEGMSLTNRPLIILVAALKMNTTLQELFLAENKLVPTDGVQLGNLVRYNHRLNLLDLRNNNLQDVGVVYLCDGLVEQKSGFGLRTLVLWNNQISYQGMQALGRALATSSSLETLNVGHNGITNEGIHHLKNGLLKTTTLLRMGLQGTRISDEGAVALAEFIADSTVLLRIDLRDNDIRTGGLMALSHAMRVNCSVTRIDLDKETKKESGMKDYAEVQIRLLRDILTYQERNVQLVLEREDAERARLEKLAEDSAANREKENNSSEENSPLDNITSNTESFTVIEAESVAIPPEGPSAEESPSEKEANESDILPRVAFSEEEEQTPAHQRPSVLFARMGLQPQESLDSPKTPTCSSDVFQSSSQETASPPAHPLTLPISMGDQSCLKANTPPGDVLLSPQYYPKQLAKKIFSVSRVSETASSPSTASDMCEYDPLNVSLMHLVPQINPNPKTSVSEASSSDPVDSSNVSKSPLDGVVSQKSLVHDMVEEIVKHIVPTTEEQAVPFVTSNNRLSSSTESESSIVSKSYVNDVNDCDCGVQELPGEIKTENSTSADDSMNDVEREQGSSNINDNLFEDAKTLSLAHVNNNSSVCDSSLRENNDCIASDVTEPIDSLKPQGTIELSDDSCDFFKDNGFKGNDLVHSQIISNSDCGALIKQNEVKESLVSTSVNEELHSQSEIPDSFGIQELQPSDPDIDTNVEKESNEKRLFSDSVAPSQGKEEINDSIDVDDVDVNLEDEPWTSVESDDSNVATAPTASNTNHEKQPDFFTTLSMNGLTQELASALTSLDGLIPDAEESQDLHCPDDFEKELDAIVAEVQNT